MKNMVELKVEKSRISVVSKGKKICDLEYSYELNGKKRCLPVEIKENKIIAKDKQAKIEDSIQFSTNLLEVNRTWKISG